MSLFLCLILYLGIYFFFQVTLGPSSRSRSTDGQLFPRHGSAKTGAPQTSDSTISPAAIFDTPPELSSCLDNSAAKHKLLIKPRNQRSSKMRRFSQVLLKMNSVTFDTNPGSSYWTLYFKLRYDKKSQVAGWIFHWVLTAVIWWGYVSGVDTRNRLKILWVYLLTPDAAVYVTISS